jgi:hypothetical protein
LRTISLGAVIALADVDDVYKMLDWRRRRCGFGGGSSSSFTDFGDMAALGMSCHGCLLQRHDKFDLFLLY